MLGIRIFGALALLGSATLGISDVHAQQSSLAIKGTCAHNFRREWNNVEIVNDFVQALNKHDPVAAGRFVESDTRMYDVGTEEQRPFAIKVGFQETLKVLGILDSGITVSVMLGSELKSGPYMLLLYVGGGCIYGAAEGSYREDSDPAD